MSEKGMNSSKYFDVLLAKQAFAEGSNITELLRQQKHTDINTSDIIEICYDLQAGAYTKFAENNKPYLSAYADEFAGIIQDHVTSDDLLLDIGTGESTTLSLVTQRLATKPRHILAFDISWSRMYKGVAFARDHMGACFNSFTPFVGDIGEIPLLDKSINVTISNHALEPNGGRLAELLSEIFRVTKDKVVLFEPCYEINSAEGRQRMDRLGYIKGVDDAVAALGGKLTDKIKIVNVYNPLSPTVGFVIEPPPAAARQPSRRRRLDIFSVPGTNHALERVDGFYFSNTTGLCFPVLKSIPILKSSAAILSTALSSA